MWATWVCSIRVFLEGPEWGVGKVDAFLNDLAFTPSLYTIMWRYLTFNMIPWEMNVQKVYICTLNAPLRYTSLFATHHRTLYLWTKVWQLTKLPWLIASIFQGWFGLSGLSYKIGITMVTFSLWSHAPWIREAHSLYISFQLMSLHFRFCLAALK